MPAKTTIPYTSPDFTPNAPSAPAKEVYTEQPTDAGQVMRYAEDLVRLYQLEKARAEDLRSGALMQERFLTPEKTVHQTFLPTGYRVALYNKAPFSVSGDFFCPHTINERSAGFLLADATGHGLSAALISMRISSFIQTMLTSSGQKNQPQLHTPDEILCRIHDDISGLMVAGKFVVANYTVFTPDSIAIANAGQPFPILIRDGKIKEIPAAGMPLGLPKGTAHYNTIEKSVQQQDRLVLFTDGLTEAASQNNELFGTKRLHTAIQEKVGAPIDELLEHIVHRLQTFTRGAPQADDISLVIFERSDSPSLTGTHTNS